MSPHALNTRILLAPWQQRGNLGDRWVIGLLVGLGLLVPLVLLCLGLRAPALDTLLVLSLILLALAWATLVSSVLEQNQPDAARLVPGHPRQLRVALWVGAAGTVALAVALVFGFIASVVLSGLSPAVPPVASHLPQAFLATVSVAALVVAGLAAGVRWPTLGYTAMLVPSSVALDDGRSALRAASWLAQAWGQAPALLTALLVLGLLAALGALVQDGGSLHAARYEKRRAQRERFRLRAAGQLPTVTMDAKASGGRCWPSAARWAYRAWFDHVMTRGGSVQTRLFLALGPGSHWSARVGNLVQTALVLAVILAALMAAGGSDVVRGSWFGFALGVTAMPAVLLLQLRARFSPTRREQALLVLLPGVPRGAALNRAIALRLAGGFVVASAVACGVGWLLMHVETFRTLHGTDGWLAATAIAGWAALAGAFTRLDRLRAPTPLAAFGPMLRLIAQGLVVAGLWRGLGLSLPVVAAIVGAATLAWCAWRWQRRAHEPSAFPVRG